MISMTVGALWLGVGLVAARPGGPGADGAADRTAAPRQVEAAYADARAKVGRDADAHVRLALWCEAHGLHAERLKHLAIAVLIEPRHATARGLMGLVAHAGGWSHPDDVAERLEADAAMAEAVKEYGARRARTPARADDQWRLALWCERKGLGPAAKAHLTFVTRLDPDHAAARKRLGYKKQGGRWVTDAQLAEEKAEAERQKKADRAWRPRLEKWRDMLAGKDEAKRAEAERALLELTDPRAVPAAWAVFGDGSAARQAVAVQLLGQIDGQAASRALATLAVLSPAAHVRQIAIQTLSRRDPRDFVGPLVDRVRAPIEYEVRRPVGGPGSPGVLFVEGEAYDVRRFYGPPAVDPRLVPRRAFAPSVPFDPFGPANLVAANSGTNQIFSYDSLMKSFNSPGEFAGMMATATAFAAQQDLALGRFQDSIRRATLDAQRQLEDDIRAIELANRGIRDLNDRLTPVLQAVTGRNFGEDREAWQAWWADQQGYSAGRPRRPQKPTYDQRVAMPYRPAYERGVSIPTSPFRSTYACFGAGTTVRARSGSHPIEDVEVGDEVLVQDTGTGALSYQPVLAVFRNPPNPTLRVSLGDEAIVATGIHRFWKAGHGWAMARDLKVGDAIRTLGGVARVTAVEEAETRPVFNLEVAEGHSFFVGGRGALVHDNSPVQATPEPFDTAPDLAAFIASGPLR